MQETTTGSIIRQLRKAQGLTQAALAERLHVSDKAVSKWERGAGMPDASIVPALSRELGASPEALLAGRIASNPRDGGNMKRIKFYFCPSCGNLMTATGNPDLSCCGMRLSPMKPRPADEGHALSITDIEDEKLLQWQHPMDKGHHLTFLAGVGCDRVHIVRLYPEGAQEQRMPRIPWVTWYCGCTEDPTVLFTTR